MKPRRLLHLVVSNLRASRVRALLAMVGIVVGTALLTFFLGLGQGLRERVLNRIFPANQLEIEPRAVQLFGVEQQLGQSPLDDARVAQVGRLPGVVRAFGKQKSTFPARLWGGKELLGYNLFTEAFFDGIPVTMLRSELAEFEDVPRKLSAAARTPAERCDVDLDCQPGSACRDATCSVIVWAERFRDDVRLVLPCASDGECAATATCADGRCVARASGDGEVPELKRCLLPAAAGNGRDMDFAQEGGLLAARCATGQVGTNGWCAATGSCPTGEYCAADNPDSVLGWCEEPLPAVINPLLLEVFNSDMARSLGAAPIGSLAVLYGVKLHVALGDSFFTQDAARTRQQYKQAQIVGFSRKAPELGLALPLSVVHHFNARFKGPKAAETYDAVLLETVANEAVPRVVAAAESLGFSLSRKSRAARTFGTVVFVTSLALVLLAVVVLFVSAVQIAQTFAMLVYERRREIAVLRALGAARSDVMSLILTEAGVIGILGGGLGAALAFLGAWSVDAAAHAVLRNVPLLPPEGFFVFAWWAAPLSVAVALICCVAGALGPARRAARLDPARVLAES